MRPTLYLRATSWILSDDFDPLVKLKCIFPVDVQAMEGFAQLAVGRWEDSKCQ